jgi:hypothetical protein
LPLDHAGTMLPTMSNDGDSGMAWPLVKGGLLVLGGLAAIGMAVALLKPLLILGVLGAAGYLGYRLLSGQKALEGKERKALTAASSPRDDFDRKMRELDALDKKLDAEIRKHS